MPTTHTHFGHDALAFLTELKSHNDRAWFEANKSRYEGSVRDPFVRFLADLAPRLVAVSPQFEVDARPNGGSLSRIYRDTRFAKDKSPYKTGLFAHIRHSGGVEGVCPALYIHFEPGSMAIGAGLWQPESAAVSRVRKAIAADGAGWIKVTRGQAIGSACSMVGEALKRPPPGFSPDDPNIDDIKRKDFALHLTLTDAQATSAHFLDDVAHGFVGMKPFLGFLAGAIGLAL